MRHLFDTTYATLGACLSIDPMWWGNFFRRGFWFLVCNTTTQLATQLPQRRIQVVHSNQVAQKRLTESNGTPAMDLGPMNIDGHIHSHIVLK